MAELTVATPLWAEHIAVKRPLPSVRVVRTGMGPRASRASRDRIAGDGPLAVMGVAGGLAEDVQPGDMVLASEVRDGLTVVADLRANDLAASLREMGFRVHVGPIVSVGRVAGAGERAALAKTGAIAVDTESAQLVHGWPGRRLAVLRSIVDTEEAPLWRPGTTARGLRALGALRRAAPAVAAWASTVDMRGSTPDSAYSPKKGT
jgi:4-hydroxy-3-methylbut-2-enyl diphosphate reductase